jgi:hypothetical protein
VKQLLTSLKKLLDDGDKDIRDGILVILGKLKAIYGENLITKLELSAARAARINEEAQKLNPEGTKLLDLSVDKKLRSHESSEIVENAKIEEEKVPAPTSAREDSGSKKGKKSAKVVDDSDSELTELQAGQKAKEQALVDLGVPAEFFTLICESSAEKQKAMTVLREWTDVNIDKIQNCVQLIFEVLKARCRDWKDLNTSVLTTFFPLLVDLTHNPHVTLTKECFALVSEIIFDKLADAKYTGMCNSTLVCFCENIGPAVVLRALFAYMSDIIASKMKGSSAGSLKNVAEGLVFVQKIVELGGLKHTPHREVLDFLKLAITNQMPAVKAPAMSLAKMIYMHIGSKELLHVLNDIPAPSMKTLREKIDKVPLLSEEERACKLMFRGRFAEEILASGGNLQLMSSSMQLSPHASTSTIVDSPMRQSSHLLGAGNTQTAASAAVDASKELEKILRKMNDTTATARKDGINALETLLKSNSHRLTPNNFNEIVGAMKSRIIDPNKHVVAAAIGMVAKLADVLGSGVKSHLKNLIEPMMMALKEKNAPSRGEIIANLNKFGELCGNECIINAVSEFLKIENVELRLEIGSWILAKSDLSHKIDYKTLLGNATSMSADKNKDVRALGDQIIERIISVIGEDGAIGYAKEYKPAISAHLKEVVNKIFHPVLKTEESQIPSQKTQTTPNRRKSSAHQEDSAKSGRKSGAKEGTAGKHRPLSPGQEDIPEEESKMRQHAEVDEIDIKEPDGQREWPTPPVKLSESPFKSPSRKMNRLSDFGAKDFSLDPKTLRSETFLAWLREEIALAISNEELTTLMMSADEKDLMHALAIFGDLTSTASIFVLFEHKNGVKSVTDNIDVILLWFVHLMSASSNPEFITAVLDALSACIAKISDSKYSFTDFEIYAILYALFDIACANSSITKEYRQAILQSVLCLARTYDISKIAEYVISLVNKRDVSFYVASESITILTSTLAKGNIIINDPTIIKDLTKITNSRSQSTQIRTLAATLLSEHEKRVHPVQAQPEPAPSSNRQDRSPPQQTKPSPSKPVTKPMGQMPEVKLSPPPVQSPPKKIVPHVSQPKLQISSSLECLTNEDSIGHLVHMHT